MARGEQGDALTLATQSLASTIAAYKQAAKAVKSLLPKRAAAAKSKS